MSPSMTQNILIEITNDVKHIKKGIDLSHRTKIIMNHRVITSHELL